MHPSILAKRKAEAVNRIVWTAEALSNHLELDPVLAEGLQPKGIKDPATAEMMRLEGLADILTAVAIQTGAVKESASEPADEATVSTETEPTIEDGRPTLDDFPAHVVEPPSEQEQPEEPVEEPAPKKKSTRARKK